MKAKDYAPRAFAAIAHGHLARNPRCALWAKPGMGKTTLVVNHLDASYNLMGDTRPTLVLAPKRVATDVWPNEPRKWKHLQGMDIVPVMGTPEQRLAALRKDRAIFSMSYDFLPWLVDHFEGKPMPFKRVVADEAHRLKGFRLKQGTARAQALAKFAHKDVDEFIELTGTPSPNGLKDLWGQLYFLDQGRRLGWTYSGFEERYFAYRRVKDAISGRVEVKPFVAPGADEEIHSKVADLCLSLDPKDWFDLKDPIVDVRRVVLPPSARAKYREMEKELFIQIGNAEVEAFNAASLSNKCLQLASGAAYLDPERYGEGQWVEVHREKLDALQELAEETGDAPLLVVYEFKSERARIKRDWPEALLLDNPHDLAQAKAGKGKIWLAHPGSVGEGVDGLQEWCNTVVFFGQTWRLDYHDQILERVGPMRQLQAGKDGSVFLHYLVAEDTVDEAAFSRRASKRSVQDALSDYVKGEL